MIEFFRKWKVPLYYQQPLPNYGEITAEAGQIQQSNFHDYQFQG